MKTKYIIIALSVTVALSLLFFLRKSNKPLRGILTDSPTQSAIIRAGTGSARDGEKAVQVPVAVASERRPSKLVGGAWTSPGEFENAGKATPQAAVETLLWAMEGGDVDKAAETLFLPPESRQKAEQLLASLPPEKRNDYTIATVVAAFMIGGPALEQKDGAIRRPSLSYQLGEESAGVGMPANIMGLSGADKDGAEYRTVRVKTRRSEAPDAKVSEAMYVMYRDSDGWRCVLPPSNVNAFIQKVGNAAWAGQAKKQ